MINMSPLVEKLAGVAPVPSLFALKVPTTVPPLVIE
jgi:hypothetical protein